MKNIKRGGSGPHTTGVRRMNPTRNEGMVFSLPAFPAPTPGFSLLLRAGLARPLTLTLFPSIRL
jgi:hypothetical protein